MDSLQSAPTVHSVSTTSNKIGKQRKDKAKEFSLSHILHQNDTVCKQLPTCKFSVLLVVFGFNTC